MYLTIAEIKKHLNLDDDFVSDDTYIESLAEAAEEVVSRYIDYPLTQLEDEDRNLPKSINQAMLLWIGSMYNVRESVSAVSLSEVPHAFELLVALWKDYTIKKDE